ncbi:hypothetical protein BDW62DRAFT_188600 [Aspergillus aurantiobrunneus]
MESVPFVRPKHLDGPSHRDSAGIPTRRKISSACTHCRARKSKCDGRRPFCSECMKAGQRCVYEDCDKRKKEAWKSVITDLERKNAQLEDVITSLRCNSFEDSIERLRQLREDLLPASHQAEIVAAGSHATDSYTPGSTSSYGKEVLLSETSHTPGSSADAVVFDAGELDLPPEEITRQAVAAFFSCGSTLFNIMPRKACEDLIKIIYSKPAEATKSLVCQVCAVAVVGSHYCTDEIPVFAKERFFQRAYSLLQSRESADDLLMMRVLACLAIYLILLKSTSARTMTASGLNIARCNMRKYKTASQEEWLDWARVTRTLAFTECWLSSTLGCRFDLRPDEMEVINDLAAAESTTNPTNSVTMSLIQAHVFKIAFLSAQIYNSVRSSPALTITDLHRLSAKLDTWLWELPDSMRLSSLTSGSTTEDTASIRRPLLFVHMIHLTSQITLYQRVMHEILKRFSPSDELIAREVFRWPADTQYTYEAFAQQLARMARLLYDEHRVLARCWLTINSCYHASLVLLLSAAQRLARSPNTDPVLQDLSHVQGCLQVLGVCEDHDLAAMRLVDIVVPLYQRLWQTMEESNKLCEDGYEGTDQMISRYPMLVMDEAGNREGTIPARLAHIVQQSVAAMELQYQEVWV